MRIIGFGDIHMNCSAAEDIPALDSADLIIITGDITNFGYRQDAEKILRRLQVINSSILGVAGNLDQPDVNLYLEESGLSLHGKGRLFEEIGIIGLGGSNYTPFNTPFEFSEPELATLLAAGLSQVEGAKELILVSHAPPVKTQTDRLVNGSHVGSTAVRTFIEQHQPLLCMTGHIHESRGEDYIGRTLVLNPGMLKDGGYIEAVIENGKISASLHP